MKRILIALAAATLALTSAFALTGCGSSESSGKTESSAVESNGGNDASKTESGQSAAAVSADDVKFSYNGTTIELNSELETAISGLGDALEVKSQLSCHGEGEDKSYKYEGFVVNSYPDSSGKDRVLQVLITGENIPTNKGIKIGSTANDVVAAYGEGYKKIGVYYSYDAGNKMELRFLIENDAVSQIDYYYNV